MKVEVPDDRVLCQGFCALTVRDARQLLVKLRLALDSPGCFNGSDKLVNVNVFGVVGTAGPRL